MAKHKILRQAQHKIYVASSWRNEFYPEMVEALREADHDVYDFRNPPSSDGGFKSKIEPLIDNKGFHFGNLFLSFIIAVR